MNDITKEFNSLREVERTIESTKEFPDNEEVYIFIGVIRFIYKENQQLKEQNEKLKQRLNWIAFGDDPELALRYLRRIGYVDFDEERKVYINKHNNEPFILHDEEEKDYYVPDEELNEYTEQLEHKLKQRDEVIDETIKIINSWKIKPTSWCKSLIGSIIAPNEEVDKLLNILQKYKGDNNE